MKKYLCQWWVLSAALISLAAPSVAGAWFGIGDDDVKTNAWSGQNSPQKLGTGFLTRFDVLPLAASLPEDKLPWPDTYWPRNRGSIAYRWNSQDPAFHWVNPKIPANPQIFRYRSPSRSEALYMSPAQLAQLSPTEKFDLLRGDYEYSLTRKVLKKAHPNAAYWEGICNGWAPASLNHAEPAPVIATNADGVRIPFGSADVKALLSYYYAVVKPGAAQMGKRCNTNLEAMPSAASRSECADVNAGAFHIVLTNMIALRKEGIVADIDRGKEIWNNPVFAYETKVDQTSGPTSLSAPGTVQRVLVSTAMWYADDDEAFGPSWEPMVGTPNFRKDASKYQYWLELNAYGEIIGGEWVSFDRPDFLWKKSKLAFTGDFSALNVIYRPAK